MIEVCVSLDNVAVEKDLPKVIRQYVLTAIASEYGETRRLLRCKRISSQRSIGCATLIHGDIHIRHRSEIGM
jgi:hypothetical protein